MNGEYKYTIPKKLSKRGQIDGITLKDIGIAVTYIATGLVIMSPLGAIFGVPNIVRTVMIFVFSFVGVALIVPLKYKENLITICRRWRDFTDSQSRFDYKRYSGGVAEE